MFPTNPPQLFWSIFFALKTMFWPMFLPAPFMISGVAYGNSNFNFALPIAALKNKNL